MDPVEIARHLNRAGTSAAPCRWLWAISIFVDEFYENYDYDLIGPRDRLQIADVLADLGFRQLNGRQFRGPGGALEFPKPTRLLAGDPAAELEKVLRAGDRIALATPTQVVLTTWRREGPELGEQRLRDLQALVREQPANLDKVRDWLRGTEHEAEFRRHRPQLAAIQEEGFQLRRTGRFRSQLPR